MIPKTSAIPHQATVITPPVTENMEHAFLGIFHDPNIQGNGNAFSGNEAFIHSNPPSVTTSPFAAMGNNSHLLPNMACMTKNVPHQEYFPKDVIFRQSVPQHGNNKLFCSIKPSQNHNDTTISASKDVSRRENPEFQIPSDDCEDSDGESYMRSEKRNGRRKIKIEFIEDRSKRNITFSKRRTGIMKKVPNPEERVNPDAINHQQDMVKITSSNSLYPDHSSYGSNVENMAPNQHLPIPVYPGIFSVPPFLGIHNVQCMGYNQFQRPCNPNGTENQMMASHPVNWKPVVSPKLMSCPAFQNPPFSNYQLAEDAAAIRGKTEV